MTDSADLDKMADAIRAAAADCGAMILETTLSAEGIAAVAIDGDAFPDLVNHLKPRLIYLLLTKFDSKEEVSDHFELEDLDPTLKKLAGKWKSRNGQTSRLVVGLVADGVLHGIVETADWFDEFEDELETLSNARADEASAAFDRQQEAERLKREAEEKKHLARIREPCSTTYASARPRSARQSGSLWRRPFSQTKIAQPSKRPLIVQPQRLGWQDQIFSPPLGGSSSPPS